MTKNEQKLCAAFKKLIKTADRIKYGATPKWVDRLDSATIDAKRVLEEVEPHLRGSVLEEVAHD